MTRPEHAVFGRPRPLFEASRPSGRPFRPVFARPRPFFARPGPVFGRFDALGRLPDALSCPPPGPPGEVTMLASAPNTSSKWMALLGLALIACGGRTADLGDGGSSTGGGQTFPCASCTDTTAGQQQATAACR